MSVEQMQEDINNHIKWVEGLVQKGHFREANPLDGNSGAVLKQESETDGPYIETKECVSGYYFILAKDLKQAKELARGCPDLANGATIEIREVIDTDAE
ncbi:YciI family protein [Sphingobacterium yanglingense]